jgi:D-arabinose 1-dehydrogenase-like Zn-dependent alcohol dehydrogenase
MIFILKREFVLPVAKAIATLPFIPGHECVGEVRT